MNKTHAIPKGLQRLSQILSQTKKNGTHAPAFVILQGIEQGNTFYCTNTPGLDPTKSETGETWYTILGYANTIAEAQTKIYGRSFLS